MTLTLTTACWLAPVGYSVTLFQKNTIVTRVERNVNPLQELLTMMSWLTAGVQLNSVFYNDTTAYMRRRPVLSPAGSKFCTDCTGTCVPSVRVWSCDMNFQASKCRHGLKVTWCQNGHVDRAGMKSMKVAVVFILHLGSFLVQKMRHIPQVSIA